MPKPISLALLALSLASFALSLPVCAQQQPSPPPAASSPTGSPPPAAAAPPSAPSQSPPPSEAKVAPHHWDVDRVRCSDLLHASDDDRASAAMFYYGYLAAKAGIHVIDVSRITDNIAKVMRQCEATPSLTVPQAFREALRPRRAHG